MRIGFNPHKDQPLGAPAFSHQVIVPVFIPNHEGYFKDCFRIFQLCLNSLFATVHRRTFITIVNNGSDSLVEEYLEKLYRDGKIHELIHTTNIGKINAILKGLAGNNIELVTIADSDVLFLSDWQQQTNLVYQAIPKAGVVGIVPQYRTFMTRCENILFSHLASKRLKFIPVKNPDAIERFYRSVGWDSTMKHHHELGLGYQAPNGLLTFLGSGHFVATYKKDMFDEIISYSGFKMGGLSEDYLDQCPLKKDYWRLTTYDNYAYHMGNVYEDWMGEVTFSGESDFHYQEGFPVFKKLSPLAYYIKSKVLRKIFKSRKFRKLFFWFKNLPKHMIAEY